MSRTWIYDTNTRDVETTVGVECLANGNDVKYSSLVSMSANADLLDMLNDIDQLDAMKNMVAAESYDREHAKYVIAAVRSILERYDVYTKRVQVAIESADCDDHLRSQELIQIALESIAGRFGEWLSNRWDQFLDGALKLFKLNREIEAFLTKHSHRVNEFSDEWSYEVVLHSVLYTGMCMDGKFDIDRAIKFADKGREVENLMYSYSAKVAWLDPYARIQELKDPNDIGPVRKIGKSVALSGAIKMAIPTFRKWNSEISVTALPGNVFLGKGTTLSGVEVVNFGIAFWDDVKVGSIEVNRKLLDRMIKSLFKYERTLKQIGIVFNKAQPSIKKAKNDYQQNKGKWTEMFSKDTRQLKQNINNAINTESAISASITMSANAVLAVSKAALRV